MRKGSGRSYFGACDRRPRNARQTTNVGGLVRELAALETESNRPEGSKPLGHHLKERNFQKEMRPLCRDHARSTPKALEGTARATTKGVVSETSFAVEL